MRSDNNQMDVFRHSDAALAAAYRCAAETARRDPHFSPEEGERRARAYEAEARKYEPRVSF